MTRGAARLITVCGADSAYWRAFTELYHQAFAAAEREPDEVLAARTGSGRYRLRVSLDPEGTVTGCYVVDVVPEEGYALLCYVAVKPPWRKAGVGRRLCLDAVAWFREAVPAPWLLVEALPRAARLYRRCGFARLAMDYRVPYINAEGTQAMQLLVLPPGRGSTVMDGEQLARIIRHLFVDGYLVSADDARLRAQLERVPDQMRIEHAPIPAAG